MKKTAICIPILFSLCASVYANASSQPIAATTAIQSFDPDAPISLSKEDADKINQGLSADKSKAAQVQSANNNRNAVIIECSKLFDASYSDQSLQKVKSCLESNNGFFPAETQIQDAVPLTDSNQQPPVIQQYHNTQQSKPDLSNIKDKISEIKPKEDSATKPNVSKPSINDKLNSVFK